MAYYELNPESPFYPYMQDTSVEDALSEEMKEKFYQAQLAGLLFSMYEGFAYTEDEKNFMIYAALNLDPKVAFNIIRTVQGKPTIDWEEVERLQQQNLHIV